MIWETCSDVYVISENRGFAGTRLSLNYFPHYRDSFIFPPFWGSTVSDVLWQKPLFHYCDLITNQVCYASWHVLSYFHNENELTKLKFLISGHNSISRTNSSTSWPQRWLASYCWHSCKLLQSNYYVTHKTSYKIQNVVLSAESLLLFTGLLIYTIRTSFAKLLYVVSTLISIEV